MNKRRVFLLVLFATSLYIANCTLSKSGSPKSSTDGDKKSAKTSTKKQNVEYKAEDFQKEEALRDDILKTNKEFDSSHGKRDFIKLGYVTPWNGHGYDVAKWTAKKYTHISPVWFQLIPAEVNGELSCEFSGLHDIDRGWLEDLRTNNSDIKIVPRFIFEMKDTQAVQQFLTSDTAQLRCADDLTAFLMRNQFEGCVFEFWLQILVATRGAGMNYLVEMTELFGKRLHLKDLLFIVPLTPPIQGVKRDEKIYLPEVVIPRLMESIDYLNLMTYDFAGKDAQGNAPIEWIQNNLLLFTLVDPRHSSKIIMGLNYYGQCKGGEKATPIMGNKFLELLADKAYGLYWNDISKENFVATDQMVCYFPTRRSIEERLALVEEERLAGVGIWELGQGLNHFTSIL